MMNKKEYGTLFFFDSPQARCPLDPSLARGENIGLLALVNAFEHCDSRDNP